MMTLAVVIEPALIALGYAALILPGLILGSIPFVFCYSLAITILLLILRPAGRLRWVIAPLLVASAALYMPHRFNQATYSKVEAMTQDDTDVTEPIEFGDSIALITAPLPAYRTPDQANRCDRLCQRLLYNGAAKRVMVGYYRELDPETLPATPITAYYIEKRNACPSGLKTTYAVSRRIAAGECLMSEETTIGKAESLYITEQLAPPEHTASARFYGLEIAAVSARRKRILTKADGGYRTLFQRTETKAEPLIQPLLFGGVANHGLAMQVGFLRREIVRNDFRKFRNADEPRIFGAAAAAVENPRDEASTAEMAFIRKALSSDGSEKQAGHDRFAHYLGSFDPNQKKTPIQADIDLVTMALKDPRVTAFRDLWSFNKRLAPVPDELVRAMAERILNTPGQNDVVERLSKAIGDLPRGKAAVVSAQLEKIFQNEKLRHLAPGAVSRLGDGNPRAGKYYLPAIEAWQAYIARKGNERHEVPTGSLIGVCLMGERASEARDVLFRIAGDIKDKVRPPYLLVIDALLNMGAEDDLRWELGQKAFWSQIEAAIGDRRHAAETNRVFCGRNN